MSRRMQSGWWVLSVGMLLVLPGASARPAIHDGELSRARAELGSAEHAWQHSLQDLDRARAGLEAARADQARRAAHANSIAHSIPTLRRNVEVAQANLYRAQNELARAHAHEVELKRLVEGGEQRVAGTRAYAETLRARLVAEFEAGREMYLASSDLAASQARLDHARRLVTVSVEASPRGRWMVGEVRRLEAEIGYLQARRPVDHRRLDQVQHALGNARRDLEQMVASALGSDLSVREASSAVAIATDRVNHLRHCFERDLPARRELRDAYAAIDREERAIAATGAQLADICREVETLRAVVDRENTCLATAAQQLQCAETDLARANQDLHLAGTSLEAAEVCLRQATSVECATREAHDRAHNRVAYLERRPDTRIAVGGGRWELGLRLDSDRVDYRRERKEDLRERKEDARDRASGIRERYEDRREAPRSREVSLGRR